MIINEDLEQYKKYLTEYRNNCFICNNKKTNIWAKYGSYTAEQCTKCNFIWINPFINNDGLKQYYNDYIGMRFKDKEKTQQRKLQYEIDKNFIELFISSGKVLDVGCSGGFFLDVLNDDFEKYGIEIDEKAVEHAKKTYSFGKNIECSAVENTKYQKENFDLIIMRGVIEHLSNPCNVMEKVSYLLKSNGYFYIAATPNVDSFCADIYREKWNLFHPIRHLSYFSVKTISKFLNRYNLKLIDKDFPYLETPYADIEKDHIEILKAYQARKEGNFDKIGRSRPFWNNMMNLVFKKLEV